MLQIQKRDAAFMKTGNSKASKPHFLILNITIIIDLKYLLQHGMKNLKFELPDGSYSISDIQDYFEYILKKHEENIDNPFIKIYVNEIKNRITFKIKTRYYLKLLTFETMKLLGSTENKMTKKNQKWWECTTFIDYCGSISSL